MPITIRPEPLSATETCDAWVAAFRGACLPASLRRRAWLPCQWTPVEAASVKDGCCSVTFLAPVAERRAVNRELGGDLRVVLYDRDRRLDYLR